MKNIGISLSGGGVRAAAFHLGVLEKLNELDILKNVEVISCVSGGSIVGAFYLLHKNDFSNFKSMMEEKLLKSIQARMFLNFKIIGVLTLPNYFLTNIKANVYDWLYFENKTFSHLPKFPKLILNATNLATGKNWKFTQEYMGDWKIGYNGKVENLKISKAVAASSAVPGIFKPIILPVKQFFNDPNFKIKYLPLSDGGIYDNQGTHSLISDYDKNVSCKNIICSDASFPFDDTPKKTSSRRLNVLLRQNDVMMQRIKNLQFQDLIYGSSKEKRKVSYFSISWSINNLIRMFWKQRQVSENLGITEIINELPASQINRYSDEEEAFLKIKNKIQTIIQYPEIENQLSQQNIKKISSIGTSLKRLSKYEIDLLVKHGSTLCGFQVRTYMKNLINNK